MRKIKRLGIAALLAEESGTWIWDLERQVQVQVQNESMAIML
jgi:hypothetical protein